MSKRYKVGIVGLGAIGLQIARTIDQGNVSNFDLLTNEKNGESSSNSSFNFLSLKSKTEFIEALKPFFCRSNRTLSFRIPLTDSLKINLP